MAGQVVHIEIPADDTGQAQGFWSGLFGWQFESFPGPSEYHMARLGESQGGAITNMEPGKKGMRAYFDVDDVNAGAAKVKELGGSAGDPMPVPGQRADLHRAFNALRRGRKEIGGTDCSGPYWQRTPKRSEGRLSFARNTQDKRLLWADDRHRVLGVITATSAPVREMCSIWKTRG